MDGASGSVEPELDPAILASFVFYEGWKRIRHKLAFRDWALDSGAFSARSRGIEIDLHAFIDLCLELQDGDPQLAHIFALDVIGDWRASIKNTEAMWAAGVHAIPTYHYGEPEDALIHITHTYPMIALGGMADLRGRAKYEWPAQCFARIWEIEEHKPVHGFAVGDPRGILALPWRSVDASSWKLGPQRFRRWLSMGGLGHRWKHRDKWIMDHTPEVEFLLRLEAEHRWRWKRRGSPHQLDIRLAGDWKESPVLQRTFLRALGKQQYGGPAHRR